MTMKCHSRNKKQKNVPVRFCSSMEFIESILILDGIVILGEMLCWSLKTNDLTRVKIELSDTQEMAQLVKCSLCKHKNQNLTPSTHEKSQRQQPMLKNPNTGASKLPASLMNFQARGRMTGENTQMLISGTPQRSVHIQTHIHIQTDTDTKAVKKLIMRKLAKRIGSLPWVELGMPITWPRGTTPQGDSTTPRKGGPLKPQ